MTPSSSAKCLPSRTNEDRYLPAGRVEASGRHVLVDACFDGHGGSFASQWLADHCAEYFRRELQCNPHMELGSLLQVCIFRLEHDLLRELLWQQRVDGAAGSIVLTEGRASELRVVVGNLGDCDVAVVGSRGGLRELSVRHRVSNKEERMRIDRAGGVVAGEYMCHVVRLRDDMLDVDEDDDESTMDEDENSEAAQQRKARKERERRRREDPARTGATGLAWGSSTKFGIQCTRSFGDYKWKYDRIGITNVATVQQLMGFTEESSPDEWNAIVERLYGLLSSEPSICRLKLSRAGDERFIVMGSDGFWDAFPDDSVYQFLLEHGYLNSTAPVDSDQLCAELVHTAKERIPNELQRSDDVTVLVIDLAQRFAQHSQMRKNGGGEESAGPLTPVTAKRGIRF